MPCIKTKKISSIGAIAGAIVLLTNLSACNKTQSNQTLIAEAKQYQQKGDKKAAVIQLKNALQNNPNDVEARFFLGTIYNEVGDPQSAEKEIRKAISLGMPPEKAALSLGKSLLAQRQFQKVLDEVKQSAGSAEDAEIASLRGNAYMALGQGAEAKTSFELALKAKPNFPDALIGLAKKSLVDKDLDAANAFSEQAVSKNPGNVDVLFFKGDLLRMQGKTEDALTAYDETIKVKPDNASARIAKAMLEIGLRKFVEAKVDIDAAKKVSPNNFAITYTQGLLDFTQGKHAAALESAQQVLKVAPDYLPNVLLMGAIQYALGSNQAAEQSLKKYMDANPSNLYARKLLAATLLKNGQTQRAIDLLTPVLKDGATDAQLFLVAGDAYMQAKDFTKATEYFDKANAIAPQVSSVHTALAMSKLGQGDDSAAVVELEKATKLDTKSTKAGILLVMTELRLKEFDKALLAANDLEKEDPKNPLVHNLKGGIYLAKNEIPSARAAFEKSISYDPTFIPAVQNLARLDLQDKKPDLAQKRFETVLQTDKKNVGAMIALASLAQMAGKNDESKSWLETAVKENPDALQPAKLLISQYLRMGDKKNALALANKLQLANPTNPELMTILGQVQFANGDKIAALESANKVAILAPESAQAQYNIATLNMGLQNETAAMSALKKALKLTPDYPEAQVALAELSTHQNNFDEALAIAKQIQKQHAKSPIGFILEGDVFSRQKKPIPALKAYEQALVINKNSQILIKVCQALSQADKNKDADLRLAQWLKENPTDGLVRMYLAEINLKNGHNKVAIEQFQIILKTEPKNAAVLNNLAWAYQLEKDPHALEYAEKANQIAGDNAGVMDTLGWILIEQGNTTRGLPLLQKAIALAPDSPEIHYHYVLGLMKSGDKPKARKELEQLLATGKTFPKIEEARALVKQL